MPFVAERSTLGDLPCQHWDDYVTPYPPDRRNLVYGVRVTGKTLKEGTKTDKNSRGYVSFGSLWLASHGKGRDTPLWLQASPARIENAPTDPWRLYNSKVTGSPNALVALQKDPKKGGWQDDAGLISQPAVPPLDLELPTGYPGATLPFTILEQQQIAFLPTAGLCIAVDAGGPPNGKYGSRVYDVTTAGALDLARWAREHSGRVVYLLPTAPGAGGFDFGGVNPVLALIPPFPPGAPAAKLPVTPPGGLAWQLGPDVDGQAGHGVVVDLPTRALEILDGTTRDAGDGSAPPMTTSKAPPPGSIAALSQGPSAQKGVNTPAKIRITYYGGFGVETEEIPWDGTQASLQWVRDHGEQAGYALGGRISNVEPVPGANPTTPTTTSGGGPGLPGGVSRPAAPSRVYAVATCRGYGPHDVGGDPDPHLIARTPDGFPINSLHQRETTIIRGNTGDAGAKHDVKPWQKIRPDGPFWIECYRRLDPLDLHSWLGGQLPGLRKIQTTAFLSYPTGTPSDGPSTTPTTTDGSSAASGDGTRGARFPSFAQSFGATEILLRAPSVRPRADVRFAIDLNAEQLLLHNTAPVAARLVAFSAQTYGVHSATVPTSPFVTGHAPIGGLAITPANYDLNFALRKRAQQTNQSTAHMLFVAGAQLSFGDPTLSAKPANGFTVRRATDGSALVVDTLDGDGNVTATDQLWPDVDSGGGTPKGYITGFQFTYNVGSPSLVDVSAGICRDSTNTHDINVGDPSPDYLSNGGPLANDALVQSDLGGMTGTGAGVLSASIIPYMNGRTLTGAVDLSATDGNGVTTLTPHVAGATKFLTELAVGDLVGNGTVGYGMVLAVDSDSSVRIARGSFGASTNQTLSAYENPQIQVGATPSSAIKSISTDGKTLTCFVALNGGTGTGSGLAVILGQPARTLINFGQGALLFTRPNYIYLWARRTVGGTTTLSWSTQRTTPYTPATLSGYSIWRRVGTILVAVDNFAAYFTQSGGGRDRLYQYEVSVTSTNVPVRVLGGAASLGWTRLSLQQVVPPTSTLAVLNISENAPGALKALAVRQPGLGETATLRPKYVLANTSQYGNNEVRCPTDGSQAIDWTTGSASGTDGIIDVVGYIETL